MPYHVPNKSVFKHTELTNKEVAGVINHADGSVTPVKVAPLPASKITSGVFNLARIPTPLTGKDADSVDGVHLPAAQASVLTDPHYKTLADHPLTIIPTMDLAHVPVSVILERIQRFRGVFWFNNNWLPSGMITYGGTGTVAWGSSYVRLQTGTTSGRYAYVQKSGVGLLPATWAKRRLFGVRVYFAAFSAQNVHVISGDIQSFTSSANLDRHIGFKLVNNELYGTVGNGTAESTLLLETLAATASRTLECVFQPGVECRFYVDGVDKGAITTNLPGGTLDAEYMLSASAHNTEAVDKQVSIYCSMTYQEE